LKSLTEITEMATKGRIAAAARIDQS